VTTADSLTGRSKPPAPTSPSRHASHGHTVTPPLAAEGHRCRAAPARPRPWTGTGHPPRERGGDAGTPRCPRGARMWTCPRPRGASDSVTAAPALGSPAVGRGEAARPLAPEPDASAARTPSGTWPARRFWHLRRCGPVRGAMLARLSALLPVGWRHQSRRAGCRHLCLVRVGARPPRSAPCWGWGERVVALWRRAAWGRGKRQLHGGSGRGAPPRRHSCGRAGDQAMI
jgi:hypothetical protein